MSINRLWSRLGPELIQHVRAIHRREGLTGAARGTVEAILWRLSLARRRHVHELREQQRRDEEYDRQHGVSTSGDVPLTSLGVGFDDAKRGNRIYRPVWGELFHDAMAKLSIDHRRFVFLDYGPGKGKALLLASDYPFQRIIGVEYAEPLHHAAMENIQRYRSPRQRCNDLVSVCADATVFDPPESPLVCFFFNPFRRRGHGASPRQVEGIRRTVAEAVPHPLRQHPRHPGKAAHIRECRRAGGGLRIARALIYELRPSGSKGAMSAERER